MNALAAFTAYTWQEKASCARRESTPGAQRTFADRYFSSKVTDEQKRICGECVVREDCLAHALRHGEPGIWAATTKAERDAIRKAT